MRGGFRDYRQVLLLLSSTLVAACSWQSIKPDWSATSRRASAPLPEIADRAASPMPRLAAPVVPTDASPRDGASAAGPRPAESGDAPNLWASLARRLEFDGKARGEVRRELAWYRTQRKFLREVSNRAVPYLHFIAQETRARKLPADLVLLPILESGYQPSVISPYGAAGLWQFMTGTGGKFGLRRTVWVDERLDVVASTQAALAYLDRLQQRFDGDWLLAIAAYNAGWGNIERAIARNRRAGLPTDIWSLRVGGETHRLAARLLALSEIYRDPAKFGITLDTVPDRRYFEPLVLRKPTDLRRLAQMAKIDEAVFRQLNPGFRQWHTGPTSGVRILVPVTNFETATRIAEYLGPSALPPTRTAATRAGTAAAFATRSYSAKRGDSLWSIARRFDTRVATLEKLNRMNRNQPLRVGQRIIVATDDRSTAKTGDGQTVRYRVRQGDSLWTISRQFKVTVQQLLAWNRGVESGSLQPGQELLVSNPT